MVIPGSIKLSRIGEIDDAVAKAILTEVPVKRENRVKSLGLDQGKGCAVGEAEVFIRMAQENALRLGLDRWGDAKDDNSRGS